MDHGIKLSEDFLLSLYQKYLNDIKNVRSFERNFYDMTHQRHWYEDGLSRMPYHVVRRISKVFGKKTPEFRAMLDDIEAEITYLLIREFKPQTIVEISPACGYSTSWILNAIKDNDSGFLFSFDIIDDSVHFVPKRLSKNRWKFFQGDVKNSLKLLPPNIDYLFIDSDHSGDFANFYIKKIFPRLSNNTLISVHDIFQTTDPTKNPFSQGEGVVILEWLKKERTPYFTASQAANIDAYNRFISNKASLKIDELIHYNTFNSMIWFILNSQELGSK